MKISSIVGLGLAVLTATAVVTGSATANTYNFEFSDAGGDLAGSGTFTTGPGPSPYTVTGISGSAIDIASDPLPSTITGLSFAAGANNELSFPVPPAASYVDNDGISFTTADGNVFNIFYSDNYIVVTHVVRPPVDVDFSVTQVVPEPSTWTMMALGLAGLAFAASRGKIHLSAPASV